MKITKGIGRLWLLRLGADFAAVVAAYYTTLFIRFHSEAGDRFFDFLRGVFGMEAGSVPEMLEDFYIENAPRIILILASVVIVAYAVRGLYADRRLIRRRPVLWNVIVANLAALLAFFAYFYMRRNTFHPRSIFATIIGLNVAYTAGFRFLLERAVGLARKMCEGQRCWAVFVGFNPQADFIHDVISESHPHGIYIAERVGIDGQHGVETALEKLRESVRKHHAAMVIVAEPDWTTDEMMRVVEFGVRQGVAVKVLSKAIGDALAKAGIEFDIFDNLVLAHFEAAAGSRRWSIVARAASGAAAFVLFMVLLPLAGLIALLIKLTSRGPVFFVQERIGAGCVPFMMYKFRTMYTGAHAIQEAMEAFNEAGRTLFKIRRDPRVTPAGRLLRRFSLDELPQLINVMRGEMAFIGPRPLPRRDFEKYYERWHYLRHEGAPGITCLWQISGRSSLAFEEMCIMDVYYLFNRDWVLDLRIVLKTLWAVAFTSGAY